MKKFLLLSLSVFILVFSTAIAQGTGGGGNPPPITVNVKFTNPFTVGSDLYQLVYSIVNNVIIPIGGVLCVLGFIYAGFSYVTAQGDKAKIENAHRMLRYSVLGTALLLGASVIAGVIENTITGLISP